MEWKAGEVLGKVPGTFLGAIIHSNSCVSQWSGTPAAGDADSSHVALCASLFSRLQRVVAVANRLAR